MLNIGFRNVLLCSTLSGLGKTNEKKNLIKIEFNNNETLNKELTFYCCLTCSWDIQLRGHIIESNNEY